MSDENIILSDRDELGALLPAKPTQALYAIMNVHGFLKDKTDFTEKQTYDFLCQVVQASWFEQYKPKIAFIDRVQIFPAEKKFRHLFLMTENGTIIDLLNWTSDLPINYANWHYYDAKTVLQNPFEFGQTAFAIEPLILWFSVVVSFCHGFQRLPNESNRKYVDRIYQEYKKRNQTRKDALSFSYEIASDILYEKKLLVPQTRLITELGRKKEMHLIKSLTDEELHKKHLLFQEIVSGAMGGSNA